ncbi:MAG TPA: CHAT domain-containing protein, partial [Thermoanaerobaculia bacterium]
MRLDLLVRGHQAFGQAFLFRRAEQTSEALQVVEGAIRDLQAAGSPFELRARLLRAWMTEAPDWRELQRLQEVAETEGFPQIAAEALRIAAYRISLEGRFEPALDTYQASRRLFGALGEREEAAVVASMNAELLEVLGREPEAAGELAYALDAAPQVADPWNRYSLYTVAASSAFNRFSRAAVELRLEAADSCRDLPEKPLCLVDSWRAVADFEPDEKIAEEALQRAADLLLSAPDSDDKERTEIDLAVARARWLAEDGRSIQEKQEAATLLAEAAARHESRGRPVSAARARVTLAEVHQQLENTKEAVAQYRASLRHFRRWDQSDRFRPDRAEKRSPAELREVYKALIGLELDAGRGPSPAAFLLSEEMRDRLAPRRTAGFWLPRPADLQRFAAAVPPGTAVIEYAIAGERTVAWVLAGGRLDQVALAPRGDLGERVRSLNTHRYERDPDAWRRTSGTLFQDFLAPLLKRLPAGTQRLVLIPDSELYGVPFRALWNPDSGRYLDEGFAIALAPSMRQLFLSRDGRARSTGDLEVLSVGFTDFLPALGLDRLPEAAREAAAVRAIHGGGDCPAVDWAGFRRCAPKAAVLHLSSHASADSAASDLTWLAFESETVNLDRLWSELPKLPLRPLVVLSACQSVAAAGGGEGLGGLARPFLASGARAVVGTLWRINDEDASVLFPVFHRAYRVSRDPAESLSEARAEFEDWREKP